MDGQMLQGGLDYSLYLAATSGLPERAFLRFEDWRERLAGRKGGTKTSPRASGRTGNELPDLQGAVVVDTLGLP